jgi:hypothetical protein
MGATHDDSAGIVSADIAAAPAACIGPVVIDRPGYGLRAGHLPDEPFRRPGSAFDGALVAERVGALASLATRVLAAPVGPLAQFGDIGILSASSRRLQPLPIAAARLCPPDVPWPDA